MPTNYLLGNGEKLVEPIPAPPMRPQKAHPYSVEEAVERLLPKLGTALSALEALPATTKPNGNGIALFTLHPAYIGKSYYPGKLFEAFDLAAVGSHGTTVTPDKWNKKGDPDRSETVEFFVAGRESSFSRLLRDMERGLTDPVGEDIRRIEHIRTFKEGERLLGFDKLEGDAIRCEVVSHVPEYRVIGDQPRFAIQLPDPGTSRSTASVLIADGGMHADSRLADYVDMTHVDPAQRTTDKGAQHGHAVTSALLFGPVSGAKPVSSPSCVPKVVPVILEGDENDEDLFSSLVRIQEAIAKTGAQFMNLSLGPRLPIDDNEVHAWTAVLDRIVAEGQLIMTVAVGNDGELDRASGNARIQVPSDAVNSVSVGAADTQSEKNWRRARYSCVGPGRPSSYVKPDFVTFGGSADEPFYVVSEGNDEALPTMGTSFAAPNALRLAVLLSEALGAQMTPVAIRALLIHAAADDGNDRCEVGWGRIPAAIDEMIVCDDHTVRVVYQGSLDPGKYVRIPLPLQGVRLTGRVKVSATVCYFSDTDPQDTSNYSRSGIQVAFRPNRTRLNQSGSLAKTKAFFSKSKMFSTEQELRNDFHKWETVLNQIEAFNGPTLDSPVFDVHYIARESGAAALNPRPIPYALVLTVRAPKVPDLYNQVLRAYETILLPMRPEIEVPVVTTH